jgi:hypothetical protein
MRFLEEIAVANVAFNVRWVALIEPLEAGFYTCCIPGGDLKYFTFIGFVKRVVKRASIEIARLTVAGTPY